MKCIEETGLSRPSSYSRAPTSGGHISMHPSAQALRALQSDSTLTIRVRRLGFLIALAVGMTCGVAQGQSLITTLGGTLNPAAMAVNQTTNTIYLADGSFSQMTVINGEANTSAQIVPGGGPY